MGNRSCLFRIETDCNKIQKIIRLKRKFQNKHYSMLIVDDAGTTRRLCIDISINHISVNRYQITRIKIW